MVPEKSPIDWCHLRPGVAGESLWATLHDGDLLSVRSDLLARTLSLEIDVRHIREHHGFSADDRFILEMHGVVSALVATWVIWPGEPPELKGKSRAEESALVAEYQAKWREESVGWSDFEGSFPGSTLDISDAEAARDGDAVGLYVGGIMYGDRFDGRRFELFVRANRLTIQHGDGQIIDFDLFVKLGKDYWAAWGKAGT